MQGFEQPDGRNVGVIDFVEHDATGLLSLSNQRASYAPNQCLHQLFEAQVERTPDAVAVVFEEAQLTYRELSERANQLAHYLVRFGAGPDKLIGLYTERSLDTLIGILGILKAGAAYLPIDPVYPKERIRFMLEDAKVSVLVTESSLLALLGETDGFVICLDTNRANIQKENTDSPANSASPENLAYAIYTSGSTGKPKGCLVTHYNVVRLMQAMDPWVQSNPQDVWTLFHSHAFDFSVWEIWGALLYGARLVVVPYLVSRSPKLFHELLRDRKVTVLNQTPSAFRQLMQIDLQSGDNDLALRLVIFDGEALDFQSLRPWFQKHGDQRPLLANCYGITETTVHVTYRPVSMEDTREGVGSLIGEPLADLSLYLLDAELQPTATGTPGEIFVGGAGVTRGYLNRPELTEARFIADPFSAEPGSRLYRSGDLARRLENGEIEFLGRIDNQLKIRGFRIELGEIEAALRQHPAIRDAVVNPVGQDAEKTLVAYIVPSQAAPSADELRAFLTPILPDYMLPSAFVTLQSIPLNANGKTDRRALPLPNQENKATTEYVAPSSPVEMELADIWKESLGVERVGIHENFFHIGGHSLGAMRVAVRIQRSFDVDIPVSVIFANPTIAALAIVIDENLSSLQSDEDLLRMLDEIEAESQKANPDLPSLSALESRTG